ncbi:MAG TPA: TonB-dependent receptor [Methylomirabilota bacterium]|nr:TonB-dependent receptor [Methylomirabilota bacterium]
MRAGKLMGFCLVFASVLAVGLTARAQVNTAELSGHVYDPQGLVVAGAQVSLTNKATGAVESQPTDSSGEYHFVGIAPGTYELDVEGKGFTKIVNPSLELTIGSAATFDAHLQLLAGQQSVTITELPPVIETSHTAITQTVGSTQIDNLPINGRNYINFTLLDSQTNRDNAPFLGAAPTSGLSFGGQRARSNEVSVDGADAVDNSVNGVRATVSQEAVQEFQIIVNSYMPEFGRATGGVVNIVTKSGTNQFHGNVFGFLRDSAFQARNPFSVQVDPNTGNLIPVKQAYTRVQSGATLGGPIQKDKTFFFLSYEMTRREESGFSDIGEPFPGAAGPFGLTSAAIPCIPVPLLMTSTQAGFYTSAVTGAIGPNPSAALCNAFLSSPTGSQLSQAAAVTGASSFFALHGNLGPSAVLFGLPAGAAYFPPAFGLLAPPPASFVPLDSIEGNFPTSEKTSYYSARIDHFWNARNSSFIRVNVSPSTVTGIEVNGQDQTFGENAGSRTSAQTSRDFALVGQHVTSIRPNLLNEFRAQYARRSVFYTYSSLPGGSNPAVDILGVASFGREPFSTVNRIERRDQFTDDLSWIKGSHTIKFGVDINLVQLRSGTSQFQLDFGGLYRFSSVSINSALPPQATLTGVQAYGLGEPSAFLQGMGSSYRPFDNNAFAGFAQDSWQVTRRLTVNYGIRYDVELSPLFTPKGAYNGPAEQAMGTVEGVPRDYKNFAPRIGIAWDPIGKGKTIIRAGYGLFYDHPPLALTFLATTADGSESAQYEFVPGSPSNTALSPATALTVFNAASMFQGVLNAPSSYNMGYEPGQQRFNGLLPNSFFTNQNFLSPSSALPLAVLPFTYPVAKNFVYAYAEQGNLTIEQQFGKNYKLSIGYSFTRGLHINRPVNINPTNVKLLLQNADNALKAGIPFTANSPFLVAIPNLAAGTCTATSASSSFQVVAPIALATGYSNPTCSGAPFGFIGTAAVFNYFRPTGPSPTFGILGLSLPLLQGLAQTAGFPTGPAGVTIPFSDANEQQSTGGSNYNGLTVSLSKRLDNHVEFVTSWTWSHAFDDSTDLQSLLNPQDNTRPDLEWGNSTFDQRHRWISSAVFTSPYSTHDRGAWKKILADFTFAPIIDVSSGLPFNVITGEDLNDDFSATTSRPSVVSGTGNAVDTAVSPYIHGVTFGVITNCEVAPVTLPLTGLGCDGNLPRNAFYKPATFTIDARLDRKFYFKEQANVEVIAEGFNLLNRFNVGDVNDVCDPLAPAEVTSGGINTCFAGQPTAALDARQFQFALKVNW